MACHRFEWSDKAPFAKDALPQLGYKLPETANFSADFLTGMPIQHVMHDTVTQIG